MVSEPRRRGAPGAWWGRIVTGALVVAMTLILAAPAAGAREKKDPGAKKKKGLSIKKNKQGENELETFDIVGKIYKPEVFLFLGRKALNLDWDLADPRFRRSFLERIEREVWNRPF